MLKVIISGGGTGGHIFPAIAVAKALQRKRKDVEILFVGAIGKMEMEKVPAAGFEIIGLPVSGFKRSFSIDNLRFPFRLLKSQLMAFRLIRRFRPDAAVGVGGFASGPLLFAASMRNVPCLIQEPNSYPGVTNRILGRLVSRICVAYPGMEKYFRAEKIKLTGNPVRKELKPRVGAREEGVSFFSIPAGKKVVFVTGGSLGAKSINLAIKSLLNTFASGDVYLIWQTGKPFEQEALDAFSATIGISGKVVAFMDRMDLAYAVADLVISRAGAGAVAEICLSGVASILVPYPHAAEDHQTANAKALSDREAAVLLPDAEVQAKLGDSISGLLADPGRMKRIASNAKELSIEDADERIADELIAMIEK